MDSDMRRHGDRGAVELATSRDFLLVYDATAAVVTGWMYEKLAKTYTLNEETQALLRHANP